MLTPSKTASTPNHAPAGLSWPLIAAALAYLGFLALGQRLLVDQDTYLHIATGRWVLEHWLIPTQDPFSHTLRGAPWTAHEWLAQAILALAHQAGGWVGVVALTAFAFACALATLSRSLLRTMAPVHALMFVAFAAMLSAAHVLARPHVLAMPLMVAWMAGLVRASEEGVAPRLWLLPVMTLWANLHGGFTLGLGLAVVFAVEAIFAARQRGQTVQTAKSWGLFVTLALLASLLTPHGIQGIVFTAQMLSSNYALSQIGEWQPASFRGIQPLEIWLMVGLAAALHQGWRLPPIRLVLLLGFLHLALQHTRYIELLGLLVPLALAAPLAAQWRQRSRPEHQAAGLDRVFHRLAHPARPATVIIITAMLLLFTLATSRSGSIYPSPEITPAKAVEAVRQAKIGGPVLNYYNFGGYLIFVGIPTYIDGRADMYGDAFMKETLEAMSGNSAEQLAKLLRERHIAWTLLPAKSATVELLDHLPGWRRLYADKVAVVHVRTETAASAKDKL